MVTQMTTGSVTGPARPTPDGCWHSRKVPPRSPGVYLRQHLRGSRGFFMEGVLFVLIFKNSFTITHTGKVHVCEQHSCLTVEKCDTHETRAVIKTEPPGRLTACQWCLLTACSASSPLPQGLAGPFAL